MRSLSNVLWIAALVCACSAEHVIAPTRTPATSNALVPLDRFGLGSPTPNGHPCSATPYRQFDFWLGNWNAFSGTTLSGTEVVTSRLGGCAIDELWTSAFNGRGRSLSSYDASTGTWSQMWVASNGCPASVIVVEGSFGDGSMTMEGRREQPDGFLFNPPCFFGTPLVVFLHADRIRWTLLESGAVLYQAATANNDAPLPTLPPPTPTSGLRYEPVERVASFSPPTPSFCPNRAAAKQFDFMIGTWDMHEGNGNGAQGTAEFTKDMAGCLVEERVTGNGDYEGWSFNTFDVFSQKWLRTYVDNEGRRIYMKGGLIDGRMVLEGTVRSVLVRVAWEPESPSRVIQRWSYSRDSGASWIGETEIVFNKR